jgi:hypothetical protein
METRLRELMQAVVGDPPHRVTAEAVRHQVVRRRIREAAGVLAAVVLAVVGVTATVRMVGAAPGPAAHHRPAAPIVYVGYPGKYSSAEMLVPISTATNTPGKPIRVGTLTGAAFTPDGKTAYVEGHTGTVLPISTATNSPGKPIPVPMPGYRPFNITMNPDGKTAYLTFSWSIGSSLSGSILPISTATNSPGKPIHLASGARPYVGGIVFSPDGKTAYAATGSLAFGPPGMTTHLRPAAVIPINTATNTPGTPIRLSHGASDIATTETDIAITPDGKTLYVEGSDTVTPISTASNAPGPPIRVSTAAGQAGMTITPDGKTLYVEGSDAVTPISTASNTPGTPIRVKGGFGQMTITPDGKTLYAAAGQGVVPISTATNTPGTPIRLPSYRGLPSVWITP